MTEFLANGRARRLRLVCLRHYTGRVDHQRVARACETTVSVAASARAGHAGGSPAQTTYGATAAMKSRTQRKLLIVAVLVGITVAGFLTYRALQENLLYFFSPTQVAAGEAPQRMFRLGGMVVAGSVKRETGTLNVSFVVTDNVHSVPVKYNRVLPDLFREGAGAVVVGRHGRRRRVHRRRSAREARRELHAAGGCRSAREGARGTESMIPEFGQLALALALCLALVQSHRAVARCCARARRLDGFGAAGGRRAVRVRGDRFRRARVRAADG